MKPKNFECLQEFFNILLNSKKERRSNVIVYLDENKNDLLNFYQKRR